MRRYHEDEGYDYHLIFAGVVAMVTAKWTS